MTLFGRFTVYAIRRDHGLRCGFFRINVPEAEQTGVGLQLRLGRAFVVGISLHNEGSEIDAVSVWRAPFEGFYGTRTKVPPGGEVTSSIVVPSHDYVSSLYALVLGEKTAERFRVLSVRRHHFSILLANEGVSGQCFLERGNLSSLYLEQNVLAYPGNYLYVVLENVSHRSSRFGGSWLFRHVTRKEDHKDYH